MEKFGFDCGKHCTNQVVRDHENMAAAKVNAAKREKLVSGSHDEAAVKQFLFEQGLINSELLVAGTRGATCGVERFSTVEPGKCVPSEFIMEYLQGKLVPPVDLSLKVDPAGKSLLSLVHAFVSLYPPDSVFFFFLRRGIHARASYGQTVRRTDRHRFCERPITFETVSSEGGVRDMTVVGREDE